MDLSGKGPAGTHLGGTGIAVQMLVKKRFSSEYAFWIASADVRNHYFMKVEDSQVILRLGKMKK